MDDRTRKQAIELLARSALELDRTAAAALVAEMWPVEVESGEFLCLQGEPSDRFFMVLSGELAVQSSSSAGRELVFTTLGPGSPVGEVSILDAAPRSAHIRATEPTVVLSISRAGLFDVLGRHPGIAIALAKHLARIVRRLSENVEGSSFLPLSSRLVELLMAMPGSEDPGQARVVRATQQQLADRLGSSRESVNKLLRRWSADGLVLLGRGSVTVPDEALLRAAVRG